MVIDGRPPKKQRDRLGCEGSGVQISPSRPLLESMTYGKCLRNKNPNARVKSCRGFLGTESPVRFVQQDGWSLLAKRGTENRIGLRMWPAGCGGAGAAGPWRPAVRQSP